MIPATTTPRSGPPLLRLPLLLLLTLLLTLLTTTLPLAFASTTESPPPNGRETVLKEDRWVVDTVKMGMRIGGGGLYKRGRLAAGRQNAAGWDGKALMRKRMSEFPRGEKAILWLCGELLTFPVETSASPQAPLQVASSLPDGHTTTPKVMGVVVAVIGVAVAGLMV